MMERRVESRIDVSWKLSAASMSGNAQGRTVNASLSGFLFRTDLNLQIGELVLLSVELDSLTDIHCAVQIAREVIRGSERRYGAEIRYISTADRQRLNFALLTPSA
jgi:hypothetical protein